MSLIAPSLAAPSLAPLFFTLPAAYETMVTVEDGTIVDGADTYLDIDGVATYATRYGFTWSGLELAKEQAILRAMIFIESFEPRFYGSRVSLAQTLAWPRNYIPNVLKTGYLANDAIPAGVTNALAEAAILELADPGVLTAAVEWAQQNVRRKRDKVGPLETETEYFAGTSLTAKSYTRILEFLRPYLKGASSKYTVRGH